ncbi:hypothetical protein BDZ97DRAFT_1824700 [Flammula alnicola]|nr:hypothetical protein BDZ97DRAFT_1824700 [Flammula alnicola]
MYHKTPPTACTRPSMSALLPPRRRPTTQSRRRTGIRRSWVRGFIPPSPPRHSRTPKPKPKPALMPRHPTILPVGRVSLPPRPPCIRH